MKFDNYLANIRVTYSVENWNCVCHNTLIRRREEKYILIGLTWCATPRREDSSPIRYKGIPKLLECICTCPIKMYAALYIERDRSHDTPCTSPMGIFYRGEFVRTSASTCVCVHTCAIHMHASREAGSNGNQRTQRFHRWDTLISIVRFFVFDSNAILAN